MNNIKLATQFNNLIDNIRFVYQNVNLPLNERNSIDQLELNEPVKSVKIDDLEMKDLFEKCLNKINKLTENIKLQYLVFSKYDELSMNINKYYKYYHLIISKDQRTLLKQLPKLDPDLKKRDQELDELNQHIQQYFNIIKNLPYNEIPKFNFNKLKSKLYESTKFELNLKKWRKNLKELNNDTIDLIGKFHQLNSYHVICFINAQKIINRIIDFQIEFVNCCIDKFKIDNNLINKTNSKLNEKSNRNSNKTEIDSKKFGNNYFDPITKENLNLFLDFCDEIEKSIEILIKTTINFNEIQKSLDNKFKILIENQINLCEQIYTNLIEIICNDNSCCDKINDHSICYKQLIKKIPNDAAFLKTLKVHFDL